MVNLKSKKNMKIFNLKHQLFLIIIIMILLSSLNIVSIGIEEPITTLGNGSYEEIITFPEGGGYNNDLNFSLPENAIINSAEMELRGFGVQGVVNQFVHDFSDTVNNTAWKDVTTENPPKSNPNTFTNKKFLNLEYTNISASNNVHAIYTGSGLNNYPYHLFRFNLTETGISTLKVYWEGYGFFKGMMLVPYWAYLYIWNCNTNSWIHLGTNNSVGTSIDFVIQSSSFTTPSDYIDPSNQLFIMAQGTGIVDSKYTSDIKTDYVKIETQGLGMFYPMDPTLDIGDDNDIDWQFQGVFNQNTTINNGNNFKTELQSLIDSAEPGCKYVNIPLNFTSASKGRIKISNISITYNFPEVNFPPKLAKAIPNGILGFYEDTTGGDNLLDLNEYIWDDRNNGSLTFSILKNHAEVLAELDPDGHHLDFRSEPDYFGTFEFQVRATDKGLDGSTGGGDDMFTDSNTFTVTVWPTNDPPVIDSIGGKLIDGQITGLEFLATEGAMEDEWFNKTIVGHDIDGDEISFSCNLTLLEPSSIEIKSDPADNGKANLSIYTTNENVGILKMSITVSDNNETGSQSQDDPSSGPLTDSINLTIEVVNSNDPPTLNAIGSIATDEDSWLNFTLTATDDDLIHGDKLKFLTNLTSSIHGLIKDVNYEFDEDTGAVSILSNNDMVGTYWINFEVEDNFGSSDFETVMMEINNVNDPPIAVISSPKADLECNTTTQIYFDASNSSDVDTIHGDSLSYKWNSNISGYLGNDPTFNINLVDVGWHNITLTVTDGSDVAVEDFITIHIIKEQLPDDKPGDGDGTGGDKTDKESNENLNFGYIEIMIILLVSIVVIIVILLYVRKRKGPKNGPIDYSANRTLETTADTNTEINLPLQPQQTSMQPLPIPQPPQYFQMAQPIQPPGQYQYYIQPFGQQLDQSQMAQPMVQEQQLAQPLGQQMGQQMAQPIPKPEEQRFTQSQNSQVETEPNTPEPFEGSSQKLQNSENQ